MTSSDITWLIGGPQGSGVETGANIFSRVCAEMGYQVFGKREFYSNIKGEHSYFSVRISDKKIHSNLNDVTVMASFDAETIFRHFNEIPVRQQWMSWEQVQQLCRDGFEIGAHTRTHADLSTLSREEAWQEIQGSRSDMEEKLGAPVNLFAYPYGREDQLTEENRSLVGGAGFRCCCSCFGGINSRGVDPFHLRRVPVSSWHASPYALGFDLAVRRG